jgi:hypothetical protein
MCDMVTIGQASLALVVGLAGGLSGSVAVAVGALVMVLAIVLVFVMVLRSNGAARKTAKGLGYDVQQGPLGQPQGGDGAAGGPWRQQGTPPAGWPQGQDLPGQPAGAAGRGAPAPWNQGAAPWSQGADYPAAAAAQGQPRWGAQQGAWGEAAAPAPAAAWGGEMPSGEQWPVAGGAGWDAQGPASRPAAGMGGPQSSWDAAGGMPGMGGQSAWNAAGAGQPAAPWDQQDASGAGWAGPGNAPAWGAQAAAAQPGWNAAPPSSPGGWGAQAAAPQGAPAGYDAGFGEADKTRVVRPGGAGRTGMIVVRQGKEPGRMFEIRKERMTIGRSRESDIFLEDLAVSRLHTTIQRDDTGRFILRDENSANGTYVNGQRVAEHVLEEGDEVQVGQTVLAFVRR